MSSTSPHPPAYLSPLSLLPRSPSSSLSASLDACCGATNDLDITPLVSSQLGARLEMGGREGKGGDGGEREHCMRSQSRQVSG